MPLALFFFSFHGASRRLSVMLIISQRGQSLARPHEAGLGKSCQQLLQAFCLRRGHRKKKEETLGRHGRRRTPRRYYFARTSLGPRVQSKSSILEERKNNISKVHALSRLAMLWLSWCSRWGKRDKRPRIKAWTLSITRNRLKACNFALQ